MRVWWVQQSVHEKRLSIANNQSRVGLLPGPIGREKSIEMLAEIVEPSGIASSIMIIRPMGSFVGIE